MFLLIFIYIYIIVNQIHMLMSWQKPYPIFLHTLHFAQNFHNITQCLKTPIQGKPRPLHIVFFLCCVCCCLLCLISPTNTKTNQANNSSMRWATDIRAHIRWSVFYMCFAIYISYIHFIEYVNISAQLWLPRRSAQKNWTTPPPTDTNTCRFGEPSVRHRITALAGDSLQPAGRVPRHRWDGHVWRWRPLRRAAAPSAASGQARQTGQPGVAGKNDLLCDFFYLR